MTIILYKINKSLLSLYIMRETSSGADPCVLVMVWAWAAALVLVFVVAFLKAPYNHP